MDADQMNEHHKRIDLARLVEEVGGSALQPWQAAVLKTLEAKRHSVGALVLPSYQASAARKTVKEATALFSQARAQTNSVKGDWHV